ncbi:hypothetical protein A4A49_38590 [Nicotiana attenuata]|uniref:DUF7653 domain-containing protein n=1 Tax=Nicotiana attenuata TaxID=49451 RepID=A0A1J6KE48_NICAT|nr:hypothetical protein A4A49_38590 [Nicotiana attenuata]
MCMHRDKKQTKANKRQCSVCKQTDTSNNFKLYKKNQNHQIGETGINRVCNQELCNRVCCLQIQGLNLLRERSQLCGKLMEYTKANVKQSGGGIDGQFLIESNAKIQGLKRGIETLTSSLQTVSSVINENPMHSDSQPSVSWCYYFASC